jgi:hypothetical protein
MQILTPYQEKMLAKAIDDAEAWEGSIVGHPDPEVLEDFQFQIAAMRGALSVVKEQQKLLRKLARNQVGEI